MLSNDELGRTKDYWKELSVLAALRAVFTSPALPSLRAGDLLSLKAGDLPSPRTWNLLSLRTGESFISESRGSVISRAGDPLSLWAGVFCIPSVNWFPVGFWQGKNCGRDSKLGDWKEGITGEPWHLFPLPPEAARVCWVDLYPASGPHRESDYDSSVSARSQSGEKTLTVIWK